MMMSPHSASALKILYPDFYANNMGAHGPNLVRTSSPTVSQDTERIPKTETLIGGSGEPPRKISIAEASDNFPPEERYSMPNVIADFCKKKQNLIRSYRHLY